MKSSIAVSPVPHPAAAADADAIGCCFRKVVSLLLKGPGAPRGVESSIQQDGVLLKYKQVKGEMIDCSAKKSS